MSDGKSLSSLTRALVLGVSAGTIGLSQAGCTAEQIAALTAGQPAPQAAPSPAAANAGEQALCDRAVASRSASDADALIAQYPGSRCIVPLLSALPSATLGSLSVVGLNSMSASVKRTIPRRVLRDLPVAFQNTRSAARDSEIDRTGY